MSDQSFVVENLLPTLPTRFQHILNMPVLGEGRNRKVFLLPSRKYVVKIPISDMGIHDNIRESWVYKHRHLFPGTYFARCKLIPNSAILVMEFIDFKSLNFRKLPQWAKWIDCYQVGYNSAKQLVAFDYGDW